MKERVEKIINQMIKTNEYDASLERILLYVQTNENATRKDIVRFVRDEIDFTEYDCKDEILKKDICDALETFLQRL